MKLSIVIVNYNGKRFLGDCLESIRKHILFDHEVIVVDNASTDGSVEYLRDLYPDVILIVSNYNSGFAVGNNLGARYAKGEYLLLLNNDTLLLDDLMPALDKMDGDSTIGILGARMLGCNQEYRYSAGYFPRPWRLMKFSSLYIRRNGFRLGVFPSAENIYQVDWVEGSFLLTPLALWQHLGGFDEAYFMYVEDIDYARRVSDVVGRRVVYYPKLTYMHFGGYGQSRIGMLIKGFRRYHQKHSNWRTRILANAILDSGLLGRAILYFMRSFVIKSDKKRALLCLSALRRI